MDPLYQLIAQATQRNMNENTQKSNDFMRANHKKDVKEKGSRANELDFAELSPDLNSMGEDLMGSMDPDMFGRSNNAERFRRAWEEELEEQPRQEEEEEEGQEQGEPEDENARPREEGELPEPTSEAEPEVEEEGAPEEDEAEEEWAEEPPPPTLEIPREEPGDEPAVVVEPDVLERSEAALASTDQLDRAEEPAAPVADEPARGDSSFHSLLDFGSGFLRSDEHSDNAELEMELLEETLPELSPSLAGLTSRLISGDSTRPSYRRLEHYLARFGVGVLRTAVQEKIKVILLGPDESLPSHILVQGLFDEEELVEGALYLPDKHTLLLEESCVIRVPRGFNPVVFYFAHAFDHILGDEGYASAKSAAVMASYQSCQQKLAGHRFADDLAGISPMHYFAQAVESYLSEDDCLEPLWTRDDLYDFDRSMYDYVDYLFHRTNKV